MMTVKMEEGNGRVPLWMAVTLIVTILIAASGYVLYAVQRASDADHRLYAQEIRQLTNEMVANDNIDVNQAAAISDLKTDMAAIKEQTKRLPVIEGLLNDLLRRLQ